MMFNKIAFAQQPLPIPSVATRHTPDHSEQNDLQEALDQLLEEQRLMNIRHEKEANTLRRKHENEARVMDSQVLQAIEKATKIKGVTTKAPVQKATMSGKMLG
jgi:predicted transcriptional regulator